MPDQQETLAILNTRLGALHDDVGEMKGVLSRLTDAITKLALIEQQQAQTAGAIERAFKTIEKVETRCEKAEARLSQIEQQLPSVTRTSVWVDRAVWALISAVAMYIAKATGLLGG